MCFWGEGAEQEGWRAKDTQGERIFQKERVREAVERQPGGADLSSGDLGRAVTHSTPAAASFRNSDSGMCQAGVRPRLDQRGH